MPNVIININLKHRSFFPNHQAILRSYFKKICFPEPSDKMPDDLEFGSDISSLQQTTFARNVRSFTTNFGSTLTIRILIPNIGELIDINIFNTLRLFSSAAFFARTFTYPLHRKWTIFNFSKRLRARKKRITEKNASVTSDKVTVWPDTNTFYTNYNLNFTDIGQNVWWWFSSFVRQFGSFT